MNGKQLVKRMQPFWGVPVPPATVHVIYKLAKYAAELADAADAESSRNGLTTLARDRIAARCAVESGLMIAIEAAVPADKLTGNPMYAAFELIKAIRGKARR